MAKLALGERKNCEACNAPMIGARHQKTGNVAPICLLPSEDGNCLLWKDHENGEPVYAVVGDSAARDYLREDLGVPLRLNHFADCDEADRFQSAASEPKQGAS